MAGSGLRDGGMSVLLVSWENVVRELEGWVKVGGRDGWVR